MIFADDLLIFVEGSLGSVMGVLEVLKEFETQSGLGVSLSKTCFFSCGLSQPEIDQIKQISGLTHGTLPIRYLGVSLCTRKLSMANCEPLISSVKSKLNSWSAKTLSFAGRLLLINTVISGITNFWCAIFTLPKFCIKTINSLCGAYLWNGTIEGHHTARVSWDTVTHSKEEGGLGVRDLLTWNKAASLRLIWLVFFRSGLIWVAWFTKEILDDNLSNFWTIRERNNHSWFVKHLRPLIYNWMLEMEEKQDSGVIIGVRIGGSRISSGFLRTPVLVSPSVQLSLISAVAKEHGAFHLQDRKSSYSCRST